MDSYPKSHYRVVRNGRVIEVPKEELTASEVLAIIDVYRQRAAVIQACADDFERQFGHLLGPN